MTHPRQRGFTLIELMVTITVLAVLLGLAVPSLREWIVGTRVRTTADSMQNGLRLAQAEAVRRNRLVVFYLTNDAPRFDATVAENGRNWAVQTVPLPGDDGDPFIAGGSLGDAGNGVTVTSVGAASLCFSGLGVQVSPTPALTAPPGVDCSAPGAATFEIRHANPDRALNVIVSFGGQVRMCNPARTLSADNPDGCPA
jgi:type IV fimbrial biogenesis protein FimT